MLRKFIVFYSFALLFFIFTFPLSAKESLDPRTIESRKNQLENKIENKRMEAPERKASQEAKLENDRVKRVTDFWNISKIKLEKIVERIIILVERIDTRIDKISSEEPNLDLTKIKSDVSKAKTLLADAKTKIETIDASLPETLEKDDPKTTFKTQLVNLKAIRTDLKEVHKILVHVLGDIKGLRVSKGKSTGSLSVTKSPKITSFPTITPIQ